MDAKYETLGQRIVEAARTAVMVHLHQSLEGVPAFRRPVVIGGAGPRIGASAHSVTEDAKVVGDEGDGSPGAGSHLHPHPHPLLHLHGIGRSRQSGSR